MRLETSNVRSATYLLRDERDDCKTPVTVQVEDRKSEPLLWEAGRLRKVPTDAILNYTRAPAAEGGGPNQMLGLPSLTKGGSEEAGVARAILGDRKYRYTCLPRLGRSSHRRQRSCSTGTYLVLKISAHNP